MIRKSIYHLLFITFSLLIISCSSDDNNTSDPNTDGEIIDLVAEERRDVSYGDDPQQTYDLYLPANRLSTTTKVVILVHGGGWVEGDKESMNGYVTRLQQLQKDYAIVNINYVLANETTPAFPNQIDDIKAVISKIKNEAKDLQIMPEFGFIGVSAGAHLSMLYSYAFADNTNVKMVCSVVGPTNFTDPLYVNNPQFQEAYSILVDDYDPENVEQLQALSPSYRVTTSSPPTLLFYGNQDPLIPNFQHESIKTSLDAADVLNSLTVYDGGHGDWEAASFLDLDAKLSAFLDEHL